MVRGKKLFSKSKRLHKRLRVFSCDCLGDRCRWCYLWRMQGACRRVQTNWLECFDIVIAISSYLTFLWAFFRASTVLLMQCTSNFNQKLKFTEVYVSFQIFFFFFLTWTAIGGTDYQNKNGQCRVKKSKTKLVLGANTVVTLKSLLEMEE